MNSEQFLAQQKTYFATSYKQFCAFGGPCVYFHRECLRAGKEYSGRKAFKLGLHEGGIRGFTPLSRSGRPKVPV
jgi:hypothetical protein